MIVESDSGWVLGFYNSQILVCTENGSPVFADAVTDFEAVDVNKRSCQAGKQYESITKMIFRLIKQNLKP